MQFMQYGIITTESFRTSTHEGIVIAKHRNVKHENA